MLEDVEESAKEELKRADHLIFVSLKYTRTADVIKNTIKRLISAFDFSISDALLHIKKRRKSLEISDLPRLRARLLQKRVPDLSSDLDFYFLLIKIDKAQYSKKEEFRKNVALLAHLSADNTVEVSMAILREYFDRTVAYVKKVDELMK